MKATQRQASSRPSRTPSGHCSFSVTSVIMGTIFSFPQFPIVCGAIPLFNCTVCLPCPRNRRWLPAPLCWGLSYPQVGLVCFLIGAWAPLLTSLTYLLPIVIPSYALPLEPTTLSLHLVGLSFSPRSAPPPPPCLSGCPQMGLPLQAGAGVFLACEPVESSYWHVQFGISSIFPCLSWWLYTGWSPNYIWGILPGH